MATTVKIDHTIYKALEDLFGKTDIENHFSEIVISAIENKLEKYNREILHLEAKYGVDFREFAKKWQNNEIAEPYSYEVESDYVDWELYEMEKKDLIVALSKMRKAGSQ